MARPAQLVCNAIHSGTRSAYAASGRHPGRSELLVDRFALSQAPRMVKYSDPVSDEPSIESTPSVVWQSRSVSVQHLLQRYISAMAGAHCRHLAHDRTYETTSISERKYG